MQGICIPTVNAQRLLGVRRERAATEHVEARNRKALATSAAPHLHTLQDLAVGPGVASTGVEKHGDKVEIDEGTRLLHGRSGEAGVRGERGDAVDRARRGGGEVVAAAVGWGQQGGKR